MANLGVNANANVFGGTIFNANVNANVSLGRLFNGNANVNAFSSTLSMSMPIPDALPQCFSNANVLPSFKKSNHAMR